MSLIPILDQSSAEGRDRFARLAAGLRIDLRAELGGAGEWAKRQEAVSEAVRAVAERVDDAVVEYARRYDDPQFTARQIRVSAGEMEEARRLTPPAVMEAIRRSIRQVREYQRSIMPTGGVTLRREGVELGIRFTPLDSAGLYVPGGKAAYPSSLIMLAGPAQVAGVGRVAVATPPSKYGRSGLVLAACAEMGVGEVYRAGGPVAIAALALGTATIPKVDKIVGPGNALVQLAKRMVAGVVGIDGFLGPSEIVVIADETGQAEFIAADLIAQAEHDPGSCFLITTSRDLARAAAEAIGRQTAAAPRAEAIRRALAERSAIVVAGSMDEAVELANELAAEHVNVQTRDNGAVVAKLRHAGAVFEGEWSAVAAGDYVAGPSHCLPTNTTARFGSGISVYEFLKRGSTARYTRDGLADDAPSVVSLAEAEQLPAHAASVRVRLEATRRSADR